MYLANLAVACDMNHDPEEWQEPPVPAGLDQLTDAQSALAEFHGLGEALLAAAARNAPPLPAQRGVAAPKMAATSTTHGSPANRRPSRTNGLPRSWPILTLR